MVLIWAVLFSREGFETLEARHEAEGAIIHLRARPADLTSR
jgi:hypothetical protein